MNRFCGREFLVLVLRLAFGLAKGERFWLFLILFTICLNCFRCRLESKAECFFQVITHLLIS